MSSPVLVRNEVGFAAPYLCAQRLRQHGDLGVLRGVIHGFSEEARTRSFASLTLVRFAFVGCDYPSCANRRIASMWKVTQQGMPMPGCDQVFATYDSRPLTNNQQCLDEIE